MGYRSDVRIVMTKRAYQKFEEYVKEHTANYRKTVLTKDSISYQSGYDYNLLKNLDIKKQTFDKKQIYFGWNNLKWYNGYEDVDAIMDSLDRLVENEYGYHFARIGENYSDIEEKNVGALKNDKVDYLEYPSIDRCFYDDEFIDIKTKKEDFER